MKTDDLIKALGADTAERPMPMARTWFLALGASVVLAGLVFFAALGPRHDMGGAIETWRFLFKFVATLLLALTAWRAARAFSVPGAAWRSHALWLLAAPALLFAASMVEMAILPEGQRMQQMMGSNSMVCLIAIPTIGLLPLAVFLVALRHGAPTQPGLAGMTAGLLAGGIAATFYAMHCFDDSPLFVAVWYTMAVAILAVLGAIGGRLFVRW